MIEHPVSALQVDAFPAYWRALLEDAYEDYVDEVEDYLEDYNEGRY